MPALSFGLGSAAKSKTTLHNSNPRTSSSQKRKNLFGGADEDGDEGGTDNKIAGGDQEDVLRPTKSPKMFDAGDESASGGKMKRSHGGLPDQDKYVNLSALRSAKLQDEKASEIDQSIYDYDAAYDTFHATTKSGSTKDRSGSDSGPKYMTSLLKSADVRKRDQLRAKEKQLQREREKEGDEFKDTEKFVTGAYKKQQEEVRRLEEEEARKEADEEERRRKGGGMADWHKSILRREDERMQAIEEAAKATRDGDNGLRNGQQEGEEKTDSKIAAEMNEKGAHVLVNDDGEVVDKRQLLSAGLNVAKKPKVETERQDASARRREEFDQKFARKQQDDRQSQRERQTKMIERQIQEMNENTKKAEEVEQKQREEKAKSTRTEEEKMAARERYLARKKEREEEARKAKGAG